MTHFPFRLLWLPVVALFVVIRPAGADPVELSSAAATLVANGGAVEIQFAGSEAGFESALLLSSPLKKGPFFPNHSTLIGETSSLGSFEAGVELVFGLNVLTTGDIFFTGPARRNPDQLVHAHLSAWAGNQTLRRGVRVDFEDLFGPGDSDFNDYSFVVTGASVADAAPVPEPGTMVLLGSGAATVAARQLKKRRNKRLG